VTWVVAIGFSLDIMGKGEVFDYLLVGTVQRSQAQSVFSHPHPMLKAMQSIPMQRVMAFEEVKQFLGDEGAEVHGIILTGKMSVDYSLFKVDSPKSTGGELKAESKKVKG